MTTAERVGFTLQPLGPFSLKAAARFWDDSHQPRAPDSTRQAISTWPSPSRATGAPSGSASPNAPMPSSPLILLRGAAHPDYLTLLEPRFRRAVQQAYRLDHLPTDDDLRRISDPWRPYRMWQTFLVRQQHAAYA